jgi:hypothetical protein
MSERRSSRRIDVDLDGLVKFQQSEDNIGCIIYNINEECVGVMVVTSDPRICKKDQVDLRIFIPAERSPVKCSGKTVWYTDDKKPYNGFSGYAAGIFITDLNKIDRRRLELVVSGRRTNFKGGLHARSYR